MTPFHRPKVPSRCPEDSVQSVQCDASGVWCAVCKVWGAMWMLHAVKRPMCNVQGARCTTHSVFCGEYKMKSAQCTVECTHGGRALCNMQNAQCAVCMVLVRKA